jgi:ethanolamine utilization protein EutQ (cupin superfamily)
MTMTTTASKRSIDTPDEVREFDKGRVDIVRIGDAVFTRSVFYPGWRWSESVKPIAGTETCELPHTMYIAAGSLHVQMDDGTELDAGAGDFVVVGPGHDAWVTGDEACVGYDFGGDDEDYAKPAG